MALRGLAFVASNVLPVLTPAYTSPLLQVPTVLAALSLGLWLLVRGVDVGKWKENEALAASAGVQS